MAVYVDDARIRYRGMVMCHMIADTHAELVAMAQKVGLDRRWIQYPGTDREHFDMCLTKRAKAVRLGALEITQRELALRLRARRESVLAARS